MKTQVCVSGQQKVGMCLFSGTLTTPKPLTSHLLPFMGQTGQKWLLGKGKKLGEELNLFLIF